MNRREALSSVALLLGGTIVGAQVFLSGCGPADKKYGAGLSFTPDDVSYLDEIAETIIPATTTPGAKDAKVGQFMTVIVNDCYEDKDQKIFLDGMKKLNDAAKAKYSKNFVDLADNDKHDFLVALDKEAKDYMSKKKPEDPITLFPHDERTYFVGLLYIRTWRHKSVRYVAVPGRYDGCVPYKKGDKAWAT